jgi:hypothetical protein
MYKFRADLSVPDTTVPMGQVFGGALVFRSGLERAEAPVARVAFEEATRHRRPPRFLPTVKLPAAV